MRGVRETGASKWKSLLKPASKQGSCAEVLQQLSRLNAALPRSNAQRRPETSRTWETTAIGTSNAHCLCSKCYIYAVYLNHNGNFLTALKHAASPPKPGPPPPGPFLPEQNRPGCQDVALPTGCGRGPRGADLRVLHGRSSQTAVVGAMRKWHSRHFFFPQLIRKKKNITRKLFIMISLKLSLKIC